MTGNKEKLISMGFIHKLSIDEESRRNGILFRKANGEKIKDVPNMCVFRADDQFKHIILSGERQCEEAELIADKLFGTEAFALATVLNRKDETLPFRHPKSVYRESLYKVCSQEEWDLWISQQAQIKINMEEI